MGTSASKTAAKAASTARQYPSRPTGVPNPVTTANAAPPRPGPSESQAGPTIHSRAAPSSTRTAEINLDAQDPDLNYFASLRALGPVAQPRPTFSPSSTAGEPEPPLSTSSSSTSSGSGSGGSPGSSNWPPSRRSQNPAVMMLASRKALEGAADAERAGFGTRGFQGRAQVDVKTIRRALELRDLKGRAPGEVERELGLRGGVVRGFGRRGVVEAA